MNTATMKILMLNYEYPPLGGGGAPVTRDLAIRLTKKGHSIDIVTMSFKNLKKYENDEGVNVYRVPSIRKSQSICRIHEMLSYVISAFFFSLRLIRKNDYDLIHTHFIFPTGVMAYFLKKIAKIPLIITAHGSDVPGYNPDRFRIAHKLLKPIWKKIAKEADVITCPSEFLKKLIRDNCEVEVAVIPNGFEAEPFKKRQKEKKILILTRMFKRKGVQYFLEAIKDMDTDWEINIAGDGPYLNALKKQARSIRPRINFLGFVKGPTLKNLYETSSIYVFPSEIEDFPVVLLEAMNAGNAIITTNATGNPEVVGDAALLVKPRDPGGIKKSLEILMRNDSLRSQYAEKAKERIKKFNWQDILTKYDRIYQRIAAA